MARVRGYSRVPEPPARMMPLMGLVIATGESTGFRRFGGVVTEQRFQHDDDLLGHRAPLLGGLFLEALVEVVGEVLDVQYGHGAPVPPQFLYYGGVILRDQDLLGVLGGGLAQGGGGGRCRGACGGSRASPLLRG